MPACTTEPTTAAEVIPISVATLVPETIPGVSLFIHDDRLRTYRLYRSAQYPVARVDLDNLRERGVSKLYVPCSEHRKYQEYLRENLDQVLDDESVPAERRVACLNEVVRDVLGEVFRHKNIDSQISQLKELGEKTVNAICRDDVVLSELRGVLYHDYHTFTHSANVACYCVMLARALGINDRAELTAIATGGLLHDAGKLDIPPGILTKPGQLNETELKIMRRHPTQGFRKLCHRTDLSLGQLMMVYQHHEHMDGRGYPVGCTSRELHEWGRLCAVADVFEALTSNRPYRAGLSFTETCNIMQARSGATFDREMLTCWIEFAAKN